MALNYNKTIYQSDFQKIVNRMPAVEPKKSKKKEKARPEKPKQIDLQTLKPFKESVDVPFGLLHRLKDCVQINPHEEIPDVKLEDKLFEEKLRVRKIRPRKYLVPQISLDDIPEDIMYGENGLVRSIYTSDWKEASKYAINNSYLTKNSDRAIKSSSNNTSSRRTIVQKGIESTRINPLLPIASMDSSLKKHVSDWEQYNPVEAVDKSKIFWDKNQNKGLCEICDPLKKLNVSEVETQEIEKCLNQDLIRLPYALNPPGYTGYIPKMPVGIPVRKKIFDLSSTNITTLMEMQGSYKNIE